MLAWFMFVVGVGFGMVAMNHLWEEKIRKIVSTSKYDLLKEKKALDKNEV